MIVRDFEIALKVCLVVIGVLLSIIISGGTVAWAKGENCTSIFPLIGISSFTDS